MREKAVTVIGAGVTGLSVALVLAEQGRDVTVVAEDLDGGDSTVAAALWAVPFVERSERTRAWAYRTLARLRRDAGDANGVREQECRTLGVTPSAGDPWTRGFTPALRAARPDEIAEGTSVGTVSSIPLIDTSRYLPWLRAQCESRGVVLRRETVTRVGDVVPEDSIGVLAAGGGAAALAGDESLTSLRTQIVRLSNPGITRTTIVRDGSLGPLFIVARYDDVVIGGATDDGSDRTPSDALALDLVARARAIEPALAEATVGETLVGCRPVRPRVRLALDEIDGRSVVHCYGHGGAGIALSWGSAEAAADLVEAA